MISDNDLLIIAEQSYSISDMMIRLNLKPYGGNHRLYKTRLEKLGFTTFLKRPQSGRCSKRSIHDYLVKDGPRITSGKLRKALIKYGLLENKCLICGQLPIWRELELTLHLDHIDGDHHNNQLSNLRILCPNCHSQTETYGKLKIESRATLTSTELQRISSGKICNCGKLLLPQNKTGLCKDCGGCKNLPTQTS